MEEKMRKLLMIGLAWLVMAAWAAPALADVNVYADIYKDKNIYVDEQITIYKLVTVEVEVITEGDQAAESDAIANQTNADNFACENCAEKQNWIIGSVLSNTGITNVNQAVGNMNNQGNITAVAIDNPAGGQPVDDTNTPSHRRHHHHHHHSHHCHHQDGVRGCRGDTHTPSDGDGTPSHRSGISNAQASVDQKQGVIPVLIDDTPAEILSPNVVDSINILFRDSIITGSINHNVGVTNVNQAAGQMNNQANATALAVCLDGAVALSETDLGQYSLGNQVYETFTTKTAQILGSINENRGVTFVNQTSGNMANQGNALSLSYSQAVQ
jgi:hypothetical protein